MRRHTKPVGFLLVLSATLWACGSGGGDGPTDAPAGTDLPPAQEVAGDPGSGRACEQDLDCEDLAHSTCQKAVCDHGTGTCAVVPDLDLEGGRCIPEGNLCALGDGRCKEGLCTPSLLKNCDDSDPCTADSCESATGECQHAPLDQTPCDDGDACTTSDRCQEGVCRGGPRVCQCTIDDDCPAPENLCIGRYFCNTADNTCQVVPGSAVTCEPADRPCQESYCDPADGLCKTRALPDLTGCSDDSACTSADHCEDGRCVGEPKDCDDGNPCTTDLCDPATGQCEITPVIDDFPCDDQDACTEGETCQGGVCTPANRVFGCCHEDADCDDGLGCTTEACQQDRCVHSAVTCGLPVDDCLPNLCAEDICQQAPLFRRVLLRDLVFQGALPAGVRLEPVQEGWEVTADGLRRKVGEGAGKVHLSPLRTPTGLSYLAVHSSGSGNLKISRNGAPLAWDIQGEAMALAPLPESAEQALVLEVPEGRTVARAQALWFPRSSCRPIGGTLASRAVKEIGLFPSGRGEVVLAYLFQKPNRLYQVVLQTFDEAGTPKGSAVTVPEEYENYAAGQFRFTGLWDGGRLRLVYGGVQLGGISVIRQVEFENGVLVGAPAAFSGSADAQSEPVLYRRDAREVACYTSSDIDSSGAGIACREGSGPWVAANIVTEGTQSSPDLAMLDDGTVLVAYRNGPREVRVRLLGETIDQLVATVPAGDANFVGRPRVAALGDTALVVFEAVGFTQDPRDLDGTGVFGVRVTMNEGVPILSPRILFQNLFGNQTSPEVAAVDGGFLLTFLQENAKETWVLHLDATGTLQGKEVLPDAASGSALVRLDPYLFAVGFLDDSGKPRYDLVSQACREGWYAQGQICIGPDYR